MIWLALLAAFGLTWCCARLASLNDRRDEAYYERHPPDETEG